MVVMSCCDRPKIKKRKQRKRINNSNGPISGTFLSITKESAFFNKIHLEFNV